METRRATKQKTLFPNTQKFLPPHSLHYLVTFFKNTSDNTFLTWLFRQLVLWVGSMDPFQPARLRVALYSETLAPPSFLVEQEQRLPLVGLGGSVQRQLVGGVDSERLEVRPSRGRRRVGSLVVSEKFLGLELGIALGTSPWLVRRPV